MLLELYRRQSAVVGVLPFRVVEELDVIEDIGFGFLAIRVDPPLDAIALEQLEGALGKSVVMTVAPSAHAAHGAGYGKEALPPVAGVLATLI